MAKKCDPGYWKDLIILIASILAVFGSLIWIYHAIAADSPKSQLQMDCESITGMNKLVEAISERENENVNEYLIKNIESLEIKSALAENDYEKIKEICAGPLAEEGRNKVAHSGAAFILLILGVIGCVFFGVRFKHEYKHWDDPTI